MSLLKRKGVFVEYADSEGPDQTAHMRGLIRTFAAHIQNPWISTESKDLDQPLQDAQDDTKMCISNMIEGAFSLDEVHVINNH